MNVRRSVVRLVSLTVVLTMPLLGMSAIASAKAAKGSAAWCAAHPAKLKKPVCANATGGTGTGGPVGAAPPTLVVTVDPNPLVETGQSEIHAVVQVETSPSFAGDVVSISSSQLNASCTGGVVYETLQGGSPAGPIDSTGRITAVLDDDGNATVLIISAVDCAPGSDVIEADLNVAPFLTGLTTLVASPPVTTAAGVTGFPNPEIETGDTTIGPNGPSGNSDVYAVFYVETDPVYAEQTVEISSGQLESRCGQGWLWQPGNGLSGGGYTGPIGGPGGAPNTGTLPATSLDDDGNAVFVFEGASCAAGDSQVIADVLAGAHPTYTMIYTISPPAPTI